MDGNIIIGAKKENRRRKIMSEEELVTEEITVEKEDRPLKGKFCWAGFIMPQFWGLGNQLPVAVLAFIPALYPMWALWFGVGGYELAYEKAKNSMSIDEFCKKQKKWKIISFIYLIAVISIILSFNFNGICNYIHNKIEVYKIIKEIEEHEDRLTEELAKLTTAENLKPFIDGLECTPYGEVHFHDDSSLWELKTKYKYDKLSKDNLSIPYPKVLSVHQEFLAEDGRILTIIFDVDEDFQIQEGSYSIYSGAEVREVSPGLFSNLDEEGLYMDKKTIDAILSAD